MQVFVIVVDTCIVQVFVIVVDTCIVQVSSDDSCDEHQGNGAVTDPSQQFNANRIVHCMCLDKCSLYMSG